MAADERVKVLEDEFKLIKSELKQTLTSVRDFLLELKLPPLPDEIAPSRKKPAELIGELTSSPAPVQMPGPTPDEFNTPEAVADPLSTVSREEIEPEPRAMPVFNPARILPLPDSGPVAPAMPFITPPPPPPPPEVLPEVEDEDTGISAGDMPEEDEDIGISAGDIPEDEEPEMEDRQPNLAGVGDMIKDETSLTTPQINLLSNLIHWASKARKEIGPEQLPVFLDIYATTGDLSPEVKDVILRLAEVTADPATGPGTPDRSYPVREEVALCIEINSLDGQIPAALKEKVHRLTDLILRQATNASKADIWSQLLLELHGILTGGGSSLHLVTAEGEAGSAQGKSEGESAGAAREQDAETAGEETSTADSAPISRNVLPARLRLVLPFENGSEQEVELGSFLISSTPAAKPGNGHK